MWQAAFAILAMFFPDCFNCLYPPPKLYFQGVSRFWCTDHHLRTPNWVVIVNWQSHLLQSWLNPTRQYSQDQGGGKFQIEKVWNVWKAQKSQIERFACSLNQRDELPSLRDGREKQRKNSINNNCSSQLDCVYLFLLKKKRSDIITIMSIYF